MKLWLIALTMAIAAAVGSACGSASAQDYPIKPIALVVPFQAGSTTDILGRILAGKLSDSIGQRVIVDNRAGAGGSIGTEYVARAAPDGYTIVLGTVSTHAINASIYSKLPYDPIKDFAPVIEFGAVPQVLVVNSSLPVKSVQELIEYSPEQVAQVHRVQAVRVLLGRDGGHRRVLVHALGQRQLQQDPVDAGRG